MLLQRLARYALPLMAAIMPAVSHASEMQGSDLSIVWAIPFAGILLSIALVPLIFPDFWHNHFGKVSLAWAAVTIIPLSLAFGLHNGIVALNEALVGDFIPFILFVGTLFVVAGGIHISGNFTGRPVGNLAFLITGAALANIMGTTGAAMLMIRPLLKATEHRKYRMHTFIFFIFIGIINVTKTLSIILYIIKNPFINIHLSFKIHTFQIRSQKYRVCTIICYINYIFIFVLHIIVVAYIFNPIFQILIFIHLNTNHRIQYKVDRLKYSFKFISANTIDHVVIALVVTELRTFIGQHIINKQS